MRGRQKANLSKMVLAHHRILAKARLRLQKDVLEHVAVRVWLQLDGGHVHPPPPVTAQPMSRHGWPLPGPPNWAQ